jgi:hypothetical protein
VVTGESIKLYPESVATQVRLKEQYKQWACLARRLGCSTPVQLQFALKDLAPPCSFKTVGFVLLVTLVMASLVCARVTHT